MFGFRLWLRPDLWLRHRLHRGCGLRVDDRLFPCSFVNVRRRRRRRGPRCRRGFDNATADAERLEEALDADLRALRFRFCRCFGGALLYRFSFGGFPFLLCPRSLLLWRCDRSKPCPRHQRWRFWLRNGFDDLRCAPIEPRLLESLELHIGLGLCLRLR